MSGRIRLLGLAIIVVLLANGFANRASAGIGACKPVKACEPVKAAPPVPTCKPVKPLPPPEACKPVKTCDGVGTHAKAVALRYRGTWHAGHWKKHGTGKETYFDAPQTAPSETPPAPAPAAPSPAA